MPLHVDSQVFHGDGTSSARIKGKITSIEVTSSSSQFTTSGQGGNINWMGGPPGVNQTNGIHWQGGSGLPSVYEVGYPGNQTPTFIRVLDHFLNGWAEGNITSMGMSNESDLMIDITWTTVSGFTFGPPPNGIEVQVDLHRIGTDHDFTGGDQFDRIDTDDYKFPHNMLVFRNKYINVKNATSSYVDIPVMSGSQIPVIGETITKPSLMNEFSQDPKQINLDPILGMNVKRHDGTTRYVPIFEYQRASSDFDNMGRYNSEEFVVGGCMRLGPDKNYTNDYSQRKYLHIGGGSLVNGDYMGRMPTSRQNISIGFENMKNTMDASQAGSSESAFENIIIGWENCQSERFGLKKSVIIGTNLVNQWGGGGTGAAMHNVIIGSDVGEQTDDNEENNLNNTGNIILGHACLKYAGRNVDGNVAIGHEANMKLGDNSYHNVSVGKWSGQAQHWLQQNGFHEERYQVSNTIDIGYNAHPSGGGASDECTLGNGSITALRANQTSISSLSDRRDKANIEDLPDEAGMAFIKSLSPKTFKWDRREWYVEEKVWEEGDEDMPVAYEVGDLHWINHDRTGEKIETGFDWDKPNSGLKMGFIAQELQVAISNTGATTQKVLEDCKLVYDRNPEFLEARPQELIVPMVKAIQELCARIEALENE